MTVIAYRDGILAADTLVTGGLDRVGHIAKIKKVGNWLIGGAGAVGAIVPLMRWLEETDDGDDILSPVPYPSGMDASGLLVHCPTGKIYYTDSDSPFLIKLESDYASIGSGSTVARTAMYLGQTATEAVNTATLLDIGCGGAVTWINTSGETGS